MVDTPTAATSQNFEAVFPPMYYDSAVEQMVHGFNVSSDDSLTASITAGSPYFKVSKIDVCNWIVVRPPIPVPDPGEGPAPRPGSPPRPIHLPPVPPPTRTLSACRDLRWGNTIGCQRGAVRSVLGNGECA